MHRADRALALARRLERRNYTLLEVAFLLAEIEALQACLRGVSSCSTCEVCREAAKSALSFAPDSVAATVAQLLGPIEDSAA